jgi:DNA polymerase-3 subunit beta
MQTSPRIIGTSTACSIRDAQARQGLVECLPMSGISRESDMKFEVDREALLRPIQLVAGVVERRQTLPVLSNILVRVDDDGLLSMTGTDMEVELVCLTPLEGVERAGEVTLPARKWVDIWRSLGEHAQVAVAVEGDRATLRAGRSRFSLATLPVADFPTFDSAVADTAFEVDAVQFRRLLERTAFAMAQQDVRYFLNGMLLEVRSDHVRSVATDGHRLAMCTLVLETGVAVARQAIIPRKGVIELQRLITDHTGMVKVSIGASYIRLDVGNYALSSKLVDGKFPDYERVIPRGGEVTVRADRETLRGSLSRVAILSNEKYRGVRLMFGPNVLTMQANNPEQEEAEEALAVEYSGPSMEIGFNVAYLLDVMGALGTDQVCMTLTDANGSALLEGVDEADCVYVVMPMRL